MHMHIHMHTCTRTHTHTRVHTPPKLDRKVCTIDGLTPLHIAACQLPRSSDAGEEAGDSTDGKSTSQRVIHLLLQTDVKSVRHLLVAQEYIRKRTPLHLACSRASESAVQELLKHIQSTFGSLCVELDMWRIYIIL